ncbi:Tripartite tricarboxylate transporter TctB family protein [Cohaesibacter sp. ES.047]|uniref:tripartite tricarboxylate transporter TctB family protein n=1 Tax=Cohaesibacter sp. ES.047 TaxID=1798205 RepID=UPI000BB7036D|nr:tripartite tricarboxylate transporter TctB family protein [Cohaesibacter sp. ES.047]SNY92372.1 Tripartite tricarboxylate transporter TctB family protein [Cohaesibacter sp. ES.047]
MTDKRLKIWGHWIVLLTMFGIVGLVFQQIATSLTEQGVASGDALFNAALFPRYVALVMAGLGVIIALQMLIAGVPEDEEVAQDEMLDVPEPKRRLRFQEIIIFALVLLYLLALEPLGFHLTSVLVIGAMFYVLDARPWYRAFLASVALTLISSFIFEGLLKIVLPLGYFSFSIPYHLLGL